MKITELIHKYHGWMTIPINGYNISAFRVIMGFAALLFHLFLYNDLMMWFHPSGIYPPAVAATKGINCISLFKIFGPESCFTIWIIGVIASISLSTGFLSRVSAMITWMCVTSFITKNTSIFHSGDNLLRFGCLFLMFVDCGAYFSIDRQLRKKFLKEETPKLVMPTAMRILQLQICIVYLVTAIWKSQGKLWENGNVVATVLQSTQYSRFWVPDLFYTSLASKIITWYTLFIEFAFPLLVFFRDTRAAILIGGALLHVSLEYTMNIQLFQWYTLSYYVLFFKEEWWQKLLICKKTIETPKTDSPSQKSSPSQSSSELLSASQ